MAKDKDGMPKGVRGPGGPPPRGASGRPASMSSSSSKTSSSKTSSSKTSSAASRAAARAGSQGSSRAGFERRSFPFLRALHSMPRWLVVVLPALLLFAGLVLTGSWAWLGGIALTLVGVFLAWLTALSWPALGSGSRAMRVLVVIGVFGIAILKFMGRF